MKKYRISTEQKFALWRVHKQRCFWCGEPILFKEATVDHILPEYLLEQPDELHKIKVEYGLDDGFAINDYCNWVPSHAHCNREKGITIYQGSPALIKTLARVRRNAKKAEAEERRIKRSLAKGDLLGKLGIALEKGIVAKGEVTRVLEIVGLRREIYEPIVVTFGLNIGEAISNGLQEIEIPTDYVKLNDWFEKKLIDELSSSLSCSFYLPEPSNRTGETLSLRLAFLSPDLAELESFTSPWWEILEIRFYSEIYGEAEWTKKRYRDKLDNATIISDREFVELLHRGGILIGFNPVTPIDYRAIAISPDYTLYQSDSYYDLRMWKETLELAGIEDWEIQEALAKVDTEL